MRGPCSQAESAVLAREWEWGACSRGRILGARSAGTCHATAVGRRPSRGRVQAGTDAEPEMGGSASCVRSRAGSGVASEDPAQGCSRLWARVHTAFKLVRPGHGAKVVLRWRISMADQVR